MFRNLALIVLAAVLGGCMNKRPSPPATKTTQPAKDVVARNTDQPVTQKAGDVPGNAPAAATEPSPVTDKASEPDKTPEAESLAKPAVAPHVERFLVMAQGGPVLVEATLTLEGRPLREAMTRLVNSLLADADVDGDGRPTWDEVVHSPEFKGGRYGNVEANTATEAARMVQLYDVNKNGVVDWDEVPRFLTRNAGGSRPFSLTSSNEHRGYNQFDSPALRLLDQSRDGRLDAEEIAAAAKRLRSRDADTDDILLPADLTQAPLDTTPGQMSNRRRAAPDAAYLLDEQTEWDALHFSLSELYAYGGDIDETSFPQRLTLFAKLDANADGLVDRNEVKRLAELEPHLRLEVHFAQPSEAEPAGETNEAERAAAPAIQATETSSGPKLRLASMAETLGVDTSTVSQSDFRISLAIPGSKFVFFANDAAAANFRAQAQGQITTYDSNSDGYLENDELPDGLPGIATSFAALDGDEDGKLYLDELTEYLRQRAGAALSQIRARAADEADAMFAALDTDNDGRLETRELDQASELLTSLDANGDGVLASNELPGAMAVGFVRGDPQQTASLFVAPTVPTAGQDEAPPWFRQMDFNGDGEISAREFLGEADQFAALDADSDGFLSAQEAAPAAN